MTFLRAAFAASLTSFTALTAHGGRRSDDLPAGHRPLLRRSIRNGCPRHRHRSHRSGYTRPARLRQPHRGGHAARARLAFADAPADSPIAFYEYSRGGGATAGAAEHAASYAPELASLQDRYFNDKGHECIGDPVESWENTDTRTLTKNGRSFSEIAEQDARLRDVLTGPHYSLVCGRLTLPCLSSTPPMTTPSPTIRRSSSRTTTAPSAERWSSPQTPFRK